MKKANNSKPAKTPRNIRKTIKQGNTRSSLNKKARR